MPKRKSCSNDGQQTKDAKRKTLSPPSRRSARIHEKAEIAIKTASTAHLLSPASTVHDHRPKSSKRKLETEWNTRQSQRNTPKRRKVGDGAVGLPRLSSQANSIAYWASHSVWPEDFSKRRGTMSSHVSSRDQSSKRRSSSTHASERLRRMERHDIYMNDVRAMNAESDKFCEELLKGTRKPPGFPMYPEEAREEVIRSMAREPEALIQTYITPTVIPYVRSLRWFKRTKLDDAFGDEVNALWTKAETMGQTQPKPDYVAGLRVKAFDSSTWDKLDNHATPATPVLLTGLTCFPLLIGEVKSPWVGLQVAEEQALHAAVIALKSQFSLYWRAYGPDHTIVKQLYGQALVFSICHNNDRVHVFAHYALPKENMVSDAAETTEAGPRKADAKRAQPKKTESKRAKSRQTTQPEKVDAQEIEFKKPTSVELEFFRKQIAMWSLTMNGGRDQDKPYNFVENLHESFSPQHLERIRAAARLLPEPVPKTTLSFSTAQMSMGPDSQEQNPEQQAKGASINDVLMQELSALRALLEDQKHESQRRELKLEERLAQQKKESEEHLAQQKKESQQQINQLIELLKDTR